jgi:biopolymer transport protein ExbD
MAFRPSKRKDKALSSLMQDEEVDVTPLMNFLVILFPFVISMAVFTQMAVINFSLPPAVDESTAAGEPDQQKDQENLDISIAVTDKGLTVTGTGQVMPLIPKLTDGYDLKALDKLLRAVKMQYPKQEDVVLIIEQGIMYEDIIHVMDVCRDAQFPNIGLSGGFQ